MTARFQRECSLTTCVAGGPPVRLQPARTADEQVEVFGRADSRLVFQGDEDVTHEPRLPLVHRREYAEAVPLPWRLDFCHRETGVHAGDTYEQGEPRTRSTVGGAWDVPLESRVHKAAGVSVPYDRR